jgi:hypothetical protein
MLLLLKNNLTSCGWPMLIDSMSKQGKAVPGVQIRAYESLDVKSEFERFIPARNQVDLICLSGGKG